MPALDLILLIPSTVREVLVKITKFVHSCLLAETPDRAVLFDPGVYSAQALPIESLQRLDDIFITHIHPDHCDTDLIKKLIIRFPNVRITSNPEVVAHLAAQGINASIDSPAGVSFFESPHEQLHPPHPAPAEKGFHYLDMLTHPGDSHSFRETKAILALPMTAPWGSNVRAYSLALELRPQHILPIHDWHWRDEARLQTYNMFEQMLGEQGIIFHKLNTAETVEVNI